MTRALNPVPSPISSQNLDWGDSSAEVVATLQAHESPMPSPGGSTSEANSAADSLFADNLPSAHDSPQEPEPCRPKARCTDVGKRRRSKCQPTQLPPEGDATRPQPRSGSNVQPSGKRPKPLPVVAKKSRARRKQLPDTDVDSTLEDSTETDDRDRGKTCRRKRVSSSSSLEPERCHRKTRRHRRDPSSSSSEPD